MNVVLTETHLPGACNIPTCTEVYRTRQEQVRKGRRVEVFAIGTVAKILPACTTQNPPADGPLIKNR